jgi:REP element-mobilizing transposase RayT
MSRYFTEQIYYFITVPTVGHQKFFNNEIKKDILLNRIIKAEEVFGIKDLNYGINSNHYHLVGFFGEWTQIPKLLNFINGGSSFEINKIDNTKGRKVWDEYHLYSVNKDDVLYKIIGYVVGNPYKHEEIKSIKDLYNYKYSSFSRLAQKVSSSEVENMVLSCINLKFSDLKESLKLMSTTLPKGS